MRRVCLKGSSSSCPTRCTYSLLWKDLSLWIWFVDSWDWQNFKPPLLGCYFSVTYHDDFVVVTLIDVICDDFISPIFFQWPLFHSRYLSHPRFVIIIVHLSAEWYQINLLSLVCDDFVNNLHYSTRLNRGSFPFLSQVHQYEIWLYGL